MKPSPAWAPHAWRFFRAGGFDQVRLDSGADLLALDQLDQKLWVALACPATGLEFDPRTLALIDTDQDGRIRAPELIAAAKWAGRLLKDPDLLLRQAAELPLEAINEATEEGQTMLASARAILRHLGKPDAHQISLEDVADTTRILAQTAFNGDGVIVADSASDEPTRALIADIIACLGAETDRSGRPGVNRAKVDQFFAECAAWEAWMKKAETDAPTVLPLGEATAAAVAAVRAVRAKVDDYFGRCRLAAFDARALVALNREEKEYLALAAKDLSITASEVEGFPLATVAPGNPLPLRAGVNPAWAAALAALHDAAVKPLLGERIELTEADWRSVCEKLAPFEAWQAAKPSAAVETLGLPRVREILAGDGRQTLTRLIEQDKAEDTKVQAIAAVEKLLRFCRDLHRLCLNFVNFKDFYDRGKPAIFQAGTLYLDQRACDLCLRVEEVAKHATMAALAGTYLAYCDCVRKHTGEKMQIVAAFTNGDSDNLMVGRNGVFYDRRGRDWDATITRIVDNPISIRQAYWSPYKKLVRLIEEQVAKRAAAAEAASDAKLARAARTAAQADKTVAAAPPPGPRKVDVGTVAALGVAFGALSTAFAAIAGYATGLLNMPFWQVCLAVVGLLLLVSGPSMLIAWLKLRKRNLGPLLDANGWAVNARARINVPFGTSLTQVAKVPASAVVGAGDPFAERPSLWPKLALVVVIIGFVYSLLNSYGWVHTLSGGRLGQSTEEIRRREAEEKAAAGRKKAEAAVAGAAAGANAATNAPPAPLDPGETKVRGRRQTVLGIVRYGQPAAPHRACALN